MNQTTAQFFPTFFWTKSGRPSDRASCGHRKLTARQHRFGLCNSPIYRHDCNTSETAEHVLVHCPFFNKDRVLISALCDSLGLQVFSRTFLTDLCLQQCVERLVAVMFT